MTMHAASAQVSACGRYRYRLERAGRNPLVFVMLNPSRADATTDDPTIRRCLSIAAALGREGLVVGNLYAWRAPRPAALREAVDPIGPDNDAALARLAETYPEIVCAWGNHADPARAAAVTACLRAAGAALLCLATTARGAPRHPLYAPRGATLLPYAPTAAGVDGSAKRWARSVSKKAAVAGL